MYKNNGFNSGLLRYAAHDVSYSLFRSRKSVVFGETKKRVSHAVFFILFLCFLPFFAHAQYTLKGRVYDADNKEPLEGVYVIPLCEAAGAGVVCDANGKYSLEIKSTECTIKFRYMGYETIEQTVSFKSLKTIILDIPLNPSETRLNGVEVAEKRYEIKKDESVSSLEYVDSKHIEDHNITSLDAAFDKVGGLVIVNNEPQMRGGSGFSSGMGSRVMVMMDEMPVMRSDAGRPAWNLIPMENIEQIEVLKGASSVLYGSSATTGAINVRTAYPKKKPETRFIWYNGFYSRPEKDYRCSWPKGTTPLTYGGSLSHSRRIKKVDLVLSLEYAHDDGFVNMDTSIISKRPRPAPAIYDSLMSISSTFQFDSAAYQKLVKEDRLRFNFGTRYRIKENIMVGLNGNFLYSRSTMTHFWANADNGMYNVFPNSLSNMTDFIFFVDPYFKYYGKNNFSHTVKGRVMYSNNMATNNQDGQSEMYYLEYQYANRIKKLGDLQLFAGAVGQLTCSRGNVFSGLMDSTSIKYPKYAVNGAAYLQLEKSFLRKKNLTILGGARYEYFKIFEPGRPASDTLNTNYEEGRPVFRAGINYQIVQTHTSFRASFGQGYRFPTIGERYIMIKVGNYGFYPNPNLKSERSWNVELGIQQLFKFWAFQGVFDIAGYYQQYKNYVEFFMGPWNTKEKVALRQFGFKFFNTGPARIAGVDMSLAGEAKLGKKVKMTVYIAYTYSNPKILDTSYVFTQTATKTYNYNNTSSNDTGQIMKYRLEHVIKADLSFTIFDIFSVGASVQYFSMMKNVDMFFYRYDRFSPMASKPIPINPFPFDGLYEYRETHNKGTTVFGLYTSVEMWNVKLSLIVSNLLNTEYSLRPMCPEAPRLTTLQLMYKFTEGEPFFPKRKKQVKS